MGINGPTFRALLYGLCFSLSAVRFTVESRHISATILQQLIQLNMFQCSHALLFVSRKEEAFRGKICSQTLPESSEQNLSIDVKHILAKGEE